LESLFARGTSTDFGLACKKLSDLTHHLAKLAVPTFICIREKEKAKQVDKILKDLDFVYDGITITSPQFLECIDDGNDFSFARYRAGMVKSIPCPQLVHRSGALFIRKVTDRSGKVILVGIENYRHASKENMFREVTREVVHKLADRIAKLKSDHEDGAEGISSRIS
jgi:hypothetical protein